MKCRACWADKAYIREVAGWRGVVCSWLGLVPLKCHHCYHKFSLPWFMTIGKRLTPPAMKLGPVPVSTLGQKPALVHPQQTDQNTPGQGLRRAA